MKITMENPSALERKLSFEIPWETVRQEVEKALGRLRRQAVLKGFRKGKAPLDLVRRVYGEEAREDAKRELIAAGIRQALTEHALDPVGNPYLLNVKAEEGSPLVFEAMVELRPSFELASVSGMRVEKPVRPVAEEDVNRFLEDLRDQAAKVVPLFEDRSLRQDDIATIDFSGTVEGRELAGLRASDYRVRIGQGRLVPGFEERIVGMRMGEKRDIEVTFPPDFGNPDLAGRLACFSVTLKDVHTLHLPALDDEFARSVSRAQTMEELRALVREDLAKVQAEESERAVRANLMHGLVEAHPFDVPPSLVDEELRHIGNELGERLVRAGLPPEKVKERILAEEANMRKAAADRVRVSYLILKAAEKEGIEVDDAEIRQVLAQIAAQTNRPLDKVAREYEEKGGIEEIHFALLRQKVLDRLMGQVQVVEAAVPAGMEVKA